MYCSMCKYNFGFYKFLMKIFMKKGCRYKCPYQKMFPCEHCGKLVDPGNPKTWHILISGQEKIYCNRHKKIGFKKQRKFGS